MKFYALLITGVIIVFILYFVYSQGEDKGKTKEELNCQNKEVIIQREIIKEKVQVFQRKVINRAIPTNDNLNWLRKNRCSDCQGR